jgi:TIR domain
MLSLAQRPDPVGFFSYSRRDDKQSQGALSRLRTQIHNELGILLGTDVRLWQDTEAIPDGALWEGEIKRAIAEAIFFIPIVTPRAIASKHCRLEFDAFLAREVALGRDNLIFPLLYAPVPELEKEELWKQDDLLEIIASRQYLDWQEFRHHSFTEAEIAKRIEQFCRNIVKTLRQPYISPAERLAAEEAQRIADQLRREQEEKDRQQAEAEARQKADQERWVAADQQAQRAAVWKSRHAVEAELLRALRPDPTGFFSYSHRDDEHSQGVLSRLRAQIRNELRLQLGLDLKLWQDVGAIAEGPEWKGEIKRAISESVFFIPIVTPSWVASGHCRLEFEAFLDREQALGEKNLIFPLLYVRVPALEREELWRQDPLLGTIRRRQYFDWQRFRHRSFNEAEIVEKIAQFCGDIVKSLQQL